MKSNRITMKILGKKFLLTALFMMTMGGQITKADEYQLYSGTISDGDYLIVYNGAAMRASISNSRFNYTDVSIINNKITDPDANLIWSISEDSSVKGSYRLFNANADKYAASTGTANQGALTTVINDKIRWIISGSATYEFVNKNNSHDKINANLRRNGTYGFACYSSSTGGALSLYKKVVGPSKEDIELSFAETEVQRLVSDGSYSQTASVTEGYDGVISYSITANTASATIEGSTVSFENTGSVTVTATAPATETYNGNTASYTLIIKTTPTIAVSNQVIEYGDSYTLDTSSFSCGEVSIDSSNESVATVDGLTLTSVAAGSTSVTVTTAENDTYVAGEKTFTLTVTQPEGSCTKPVGTVSVFEENFNTIEGLGGNDGRWSGSLGVSGGKIDTWSYEYAAGSKQCMRCGTTSAGGYIQTPALPLEVGVDYTLTFKAGAWEATDEGTTLLLSATNATLNQTSVSLKKGAWTDYEIQVSATAANSTIKFYTTAGSRRFFLDEVAITRQGDDVISTSVTTVGGYATYCYLYPLNLDGVEGAKAYKVSSVDLANERIFLTQLTGTIQGGVPFILKADGEDDTFEIPLAESSTNVPEDNALLGTLVPTFVPQTSGNITNFAYSKTKECFVKIGSAGNTVPANRAYLPVNIGSEVKSFSFVFTDTDDISALRVKNEGVNNEAFIFNLAGQRLSKLLKGVNIVNGKKKFVK